MTPNYWNSLKGGSDSFSQNSPFPSSIWNSERKWEKQETESERIRRMDEKEVVATSDTNGIAKSNKILKQMKKKLSRMLTHLSEESLRRHSSCWTSSPSCLSSILHRETPSQLWRASPCRTSYTSPPWIPLLHVGAMNVSLRDCRAIELSSISASASGWSVNPAK